MLRFIPFFAALFLCCFALQTQAQRTVSTSAPGSGRSCASNPCLNGGLCIDQPNGFVCRCQSPWTGRICNSYQGTSATFTRSIVKRQVGSVCTANRCKNGGTCYLVDTEAICLCPWPWAGDECMENLEKPSPATSTSRVPTTAVFQTTARPMTTPFAQTTARPFTTSFVQTTARPVTGFTTAPTSGSCAQSPCKNGGTCVPRGFSYSCFCGLNSIYSGKNCDSTAPLSKEECPLNCTPAKCVFSGYAERPYACLWNGIMRPATGTTG